MGDAFWTYCPVFIIIRAVLKPTLLFYSGDNMKKWLMLMLLIIPAYACAEESLISAATNGDVQFIRNYKGNIDLSLDDEGWTALMEAASYGKTEAVAALIGRKADVDMTNKLGYTALMFASLKGQTGAVRLLIAAKANVNAMNNEGFTALMGAAEEGETGAVEDLIAAKALVNAADKNGQTALMWATYISYIEHYDAVNALIKARANVNQKDRGGNTALMFAAGRDQSDIVRILIGAGADVNALNLSGNTVLSFAKDPTIVNMLKLAGAK